MSSPDSRVYEPSALVKEPCSKTPVSSAKKQNSSREKKTLRSCMASSVSMLLCLMTSS